MKRIIVAVCLFTLPCAAAQPPSWFAPLASRCAPEVDAGTLARIARAESGFKTWVLSIDYPATTARRLGFPPGRVFLKHQPRTRAEAAVWIRSLLGANYSIGVGLMQISGRDAARAQAALDPCWNIREGAAIFRNNYSTAAARVGQGSRAFRMALSAYNSGSFSDPDGRYVQMVLGR